MIPGHAQAARHVADGRELRGPGVDDEAHRHGLDRREAGLACRQAIDEPEPDRPDGESEGIDDELAATCSEFLGVGQRRNVLPHVPSHTTNTAWRSRA